MRPLARESATVSLMQSFSSGLAKVAGGVSGASEVIPPSYSSLVSSDFQLGMPTVHPDVDIPSSDPADMDTDVHHQSARLISIHYMNNSILTSNYSQLQDLERAARRLYLIDESTSISISVEIPMITAAKIKVDAKGWKAIRMEVSSVWLITQPIDSVATHKILLDPIDDSVNEGQSISINIHPSATIWGLKEIIFRKLPKYDPRTLDIWTSGPHPCELSGILRNQQAASESSYRFNMKIRNETPTYPTRRPNLWESAFNPPKAADYQISRASGYGTFRASDYDAASASRESAPNPIRESSLAPEVTSVANSSILRLNGCLMMHYENEIVLTRRDERYKDLESSARQSFCIAESALVCIEAKIVTFGTHRTGIDPGIWANVSKDISEIWITTRTRLPRCRVITLTRSLKNRNHGDVSLRMKVDYGAKGLDIKQALTRVYSSSPPESIQVKHGGGYGLVSDNEPVTAERYHIEASCTTCQRAGEMGGVYGVPEHFCLLHADQPKPAVRPLIWCLCRSD